MSRFLRLSLAQVLLLISLVALIVTVTTMAQRRFSVMSSVPPLAVSPDGQSLAMGLSCRPIFSRKHPVQVQDLTKLSSSPRLFESHKWLVEGVAFSPGGDTIYSVGDWSLCTWDAKTGEQLDRFDTGSDVRACLAASPDGKLVATANENVVRIWDVKKREEIATLTGHLKRNGVTDVAFSPDGRYLVTGGFDLKLMVWDTATWQTTNQIATTTVPHKIAFLPDGRLVAPGRPEKQESTPNKASVIVYEIQTGSSLATIPINSHAAVSCIAASPDGRYFAAAHGGDRELERTAITVWDATNMEELNTWTVEGHRDYWIDSMAFSADGDTLYCGTMNRIVSAEDWKTGRGEVLFSVPRVFPWKLALGGGILWLIAWRAAPPGLASKALDTQRNPAGKRSIVGA